MQHVKWFMRCNGVFSCFSGWLRSGNQVGTPTTLARRALKGMWVTRCVHGEDGDSAVAGRSKLLNHTEHDSMLDKQGQGAPPLLTQSAKQLQQPEGLQGEQDEDAPNSISSSLRDVQ